MKLDPLKQYAKLRKQLLSERNRIEARLQEINQVLGGTASTEAPLGSPAPVRGRGRKPGRGNALSMREAVLKALAKRPLARQELVKAVEDVGYVFTTKHPLNSIGAILYGKNSPVKNEDGKFYLASGAARETRSNGRGQPVAPKGKRAMGPEAEAKISAAQTADWAKRRRAQKA